MIKEEIINNLRHLSHSPFLMFMGKLDERKDNDAIMLSLLATETNVTAGRIAEVLDIKPSSVTQLIKKFSEAGMVERIKSEQDARVTFVKLTVLGSQMVDARQNAANDLNQALFKSFSEAELIAFNQGIRKLSDALESQEFHDQLMTAFGNDERWKLFEKVNSRLGQARGRMMREFDFRGGRESKDHYFGEVMRERQQRSGFHNQPEDMRNNPFFDKFK